MVASRHFIRYGLAFIVLCLGTLGVHARLLDGIDGEALALAFGDDTTYAAGYTDAGFRHVQKGMTLENVRRSVGKPFGETLDYQIDQCDRVYVRDGLATEPIFAGCASRGVRPQMTTADIVRILGEPKMVTGLYSESRHDSSYRLRIISFQQGAVTEIITGFYVD